MVIGRKRKSETVSKIDIKISVWLSVKSIRVHEDKLMTIQYDFRIGVKLKYLNMVVYFTKIYKSYKMKILKTEFWKS